MVSASVVDPWHFGTDPDLNSDIESCFFHQWLKMPIKNKFFPKLFCLLLFEGSQGTFTWVFIDKKSKRSHKIVEIKVFLTFFACCWKDLDPDPDPYKIMTDPDGPKTVVLAVFHPDPEPDPKFFEATDRKVSVEEI
jgi:hypothetical protein